MSVNKSTGRGLGRGLDSLIPLGDDSVAQSNGNSRERFLSIPTEDIIPNPLQPRQTFSDESLADLAKSIEEHGIIQPLVVTRAENGYELIAGERRLRAAKVVGLKSVPAIVRSDKNLKKLEVAIIENIQRDDLNVLDEARAYQKLMHDYSLSQDEVAKRMGKSRSAVANKMRLLALPVEIKRALNSGQITEGHARAILGLDNVEKMLLVFGLVIAKKLSVREIEKKVSELLSGQTVNIKKEDVDPNLRHLENELTNAIGSKVQIKSKKKGGQVVIDYNSSDELERILGFLR